VHLQAAKVRKVPVIIVVDIVQSRIDLAKSLGATHGINSRGMTKDELITAIASVPPFRKSPSNPTPPLGPTCILDTTGIPSLLQAALASVNRMGRVIQLANQGPGSKVEIGLPEHMRDGVHLTGTIQGDAVGEKSLPMLIGWYRKGNLPLERLEKFYMVEEFEKAREGMHNGSVIKPVLIW
jgi:Zn-dependent alcohol dehydrogenase